MWSEEDLIKETAGRTGLNLPTWTEEELDEENKKKMGTGINVPDWKPDETLIECPKCGYANKPEWGDTCAMCDAPLSSEVSLEESKQEPEEESEELIDEDKEETDE